MFYFFRSVLKANSGLNWSLYLLFVLLKNDAVDFTVHLALGGWVCSCVCVYVCVCVGGGGRGVRFRDGQFSRNKGLGYLHHLACVSLCTCAPLYSLTRVQKVHNRLSLMRKTSTIFTAGLCVFQYNLGFFFWVYCLILNARSISSKQIILKLKGLTVKMLDYDR